MVTCNAVDEYSELCLHGGCLNGQGQIPPRLQNMTVWGKFSAGTDSPKINHD